MTTFVLVHGAFVGGWYWRWVARHLRAAGYQVVVPTMTGLGHRAHLATPEVSLETHIQDILTIYRYEDLRETILIGHSYGGMIVAGVADRVPDRVSHLVYFDSDVPRDRDTSAPASRHEALSARARAGDGWRVPAPVEFFRSQLDGQPASTIDWFLERLVPHPVRTWLEPIPLGGAAAPIPTTYLRCLVGYAPGDEDTARQDARIRSEQSWRYRELDAPHMALVTHPAQSAHLFIEAARTAP